MTASEMADIEQRYPELFHRPLLQRQGLWFLIGGTFLYLAYTVWFFSLPQVLAEAHWERLGLYLTQWVSYDVQPEFRLRRPVLNPKNPPFSPVGGGAPPGWVEN